jgi:hypothetical protein
MRRGIPISYSQASEFPQANTCRELASSTDLGLDGQVGTHLTIWSLVKRTPMKQVAETS